MNAKWKNITVCQLCKMNQSSYTSKDHWEYINYLDTGSITRNVIEGYEHIDLTKVKLPSRAKRKVAVGDIIYSTVRPNLCHYGMLGEVPENCLVSTGFAVIKADEAEVNPRFLYYYLTLPEIVESLHSIGEQGQATYPAINPSDIEDLEISIPERNVQNKIVTVLSDYDAAIANCRKQIALLEEAAMRLYREWFGDGKGEKRTLRSLVEDIESGSRPRGGAQKDGVPSIGAEKIEGIGVYNFDGEKFISEDYFDRMRRGKIRDEDILLYKDGAYCGKVSMVLDGFPHSKAAVNEHVFILRAPRKTAFLYCFLITSESYALLNQLACNKAAQPGLNQDDVLDVPIILPDLKCIEKFEQCAMPLMHAIAMHANQIRSLTEARDRLLPKLMKGEIAV